MGPQVSFKELLLIAQIIFLLAGTPTPNPEQPFGDGQTLTYARQTSPAF